MTFFLQFLKINNVSIFHIYLYQPRAGNESGTFSSSQEEIQRNDIVGEIGGA